MGAVIGGLGSHDAGTRIILEVGDWVVIPITVSQDVYKVGPCQL